MSEEKDKKRIACGTGLVSFEAAKKAKKAKKVYGVDIAPSMIEEAKKKTREMEIKNVEFSVEDAYRLPFDKFKIALTISTMIGQLPVFHKLNLDEFADFINKSGFTVVKKEKIKHPGDRMALLYVVAEGGEQK